MEVTQQPLSANEDQREPGLGLFLPLGGLEGETLLEVHTQDNAAAILPALVFVYLRPYAISCFVFRDSLTP